MKETKELLKFVVKFAEALEKSINAGKAKDWAMVFAVLPGLVVDAVPAFSDIKLIKDEVAAMDEAKKAELVEAVKALDLADDKAEKAVELGLVVAVHLLDIVDLVKKA